ncbi:uncharacterized protein MEPE_06103 [Melanopsichium pennsylvanicum]|uniref:Uncharacterized protein n=1 Tax=Melanopsichium pennsylvanicum TaxID=63383 RepID=A0AAJ4XS92_9BASI|nr:uncharacterized protein MEPE_06103 [Melanopsichium pennsylvanicum]
MPNSVVTFICLVVLSILQPVSSLPTGGQQGPKDWYPYSLYHDTSSNSYPEVNSWVAPDAQQSTTVFGHDLTAGPSQQPAAWMEGQPEGWNQDHHSWGLGLPQQRTADHRLFGVDLAAGPSQQPAAWMEGQPEGWNQDHHSWGLGLPQQRTADHRLFGVDLAAGPSQQPAAWMEGQPEGWNQDHHSWGLGLPQQRTADHRLFGVDLAAGPSQQPAAWMEGQPEGWNQDHHSWGLGLPQQRTADHRLFGVDLTAGPSQQPAAWMEGQPEGWNQDHHSLGLGLPQQRATLTEAWRYGHTLNLGLPQQETAGSSLFGRPLGVGPSEIAGASSNPGVTDLNNPPDNSDGLLPHQSPDIHVNVMKELDAGHHAVLNFNIYDGQLSTTIPASLLSDETEGKLKDWSHTGFANRFVRYLVFRAGGEAGYDYLYLTRPMTESDYKQIFPQLQIDHTKFIPMVVHRTKLGQKNFYPFGDVDIVGIQFVSPKPFQTLRSVGVKKVELRQVVDAIRKGLHS